MSLYVPRKSGSASDVSHRYLWGPSVDQLFADEQPTSTSSAGNVLWGLGDNLGTLRDIADLSGSTASVTNHRRFGAYGDLVSESNSAVDMAFAFTGKLYDENTKLQNNLNRWYDAAIGQWLNEDPLGFEAGDENIRRYVSNRSLQLSDPTGLEPPDMNPGSDNCYADAFRNRPPYRIDVRTEADTLADEAWLRGILPSAGEALIVVVATVGGRGRRGRAGSRRNPDGSPKTPLEQHDQIKEAQKRNRADGGDAINDTTKSEQNVKKYLKDFDPKNPD